MPLPRVLKSHRYAQSPKNCFNCSQYLRLVYPPKFYSQTDSTVEQGRAALRPALSFLAEPLFNDNRYAISALDLVDTLGTISLTPGLVFLPPGPETRRPCRRRARPPSSPLQLALLPQHGHLQVTMRLIHPSPLDLRYVYSK